MVVKAFSTWERVCVFVCACDCSALASRCLQLVVHYIPVIRSHFETKLQPKQFSVLRHFDHITKVGDKNKLLVLSGIQPAAWTDISLTPMLVFAQDYNDHVAEISAKLVAIMDSMFEKSLSKVSGAGAGLKGLVI